MKANILGVLIDQLTMAEALDRIEKFLEVGGQHYVVTPNPEMVILAQKDQEFKNILNQADLAIPDGFGLILASIWLGERIKERVTGADLVLQLGEKIENTEYKLFLLGGQSGVAKRAAANLKERFPGLKIVGAEEGVEEVGKLGYWETNDLDNRINQARPDILLVAFGQGKQEKWIYYNLPRLKTVRVAIGVGGTFDYLAGNISRAPKILQKLGLEWSWRLVVEPRRWQRILTAVILFPLAVFKKRN